MSVDLCADTNGDAISFINPDSLAVLKYFAYWIDQNSAKGKNYRGGQYWTYNSIPTLLKYFSWATMSKMKTILKYLLREGLIITGNFNKHQYDRTKWYSLTEKARKLLILTISQNRPMDRSNLADGSVKIDRPIPNNKTYNKNRERGGAETTPPPSPALDDQNLINNRANTRVGGVNPNLKSWEEGGICSDSDHTSSKFHYQQSSHFSPNEEAKKFAEGNEIDLDSELEKYLLHLKAFSKKPKDMNAHFLLWLHKANRGVKTFLKEDFFPSKETINVAEECALTESETNEEFSKFTKYYRKSKRKEADWDFVLQNWFRRAVEYRRDDRSVDHFSNRKDEVKCVIPFVGTDEWRHFNGYETEGRAEAR